jgi:hypothetical protein
MSYQRVIPRDLFNEANLLKCYGQLYLQLERLNIPGVELVHDGEMFDIDQDPVDGSLFFENVRLWVHDEPQILFRQLNSREPWPLYIDGTEAPEPFAVFNDDGTLSEEMLTFLRGAE